MSWRGRGIGRLLGRAGGVVAVAVLALATFGGTAYADNRLLETDHVRLTSAGFYFGDGTWSTTGYDQKADVKWKVDEADITPTVSGKLGLWGVDGECARIRIDYYTSGGSYLNTTWGGTVCATTNGINEWSVDQTRWASDQTGKITVSIEHQLSSGDWAIVDSQSVSLGTYVDDKVQISWTDGNGGVPGIGFGDSGWSSGTYTPTGFGTVTWTRRTGQNWPHLTGTVHLESAAGDCVRMRLDYYSDTAFLDTETGGTVCAIDNAHYKWSVDLEPWGGDAVQHVRVSIERQLDPTTWQIADSTTSYYGT
jgi:hypothetical protein